MIFFVQNQDFLLIQLVKGDYLVVIIIVVFRLGVVFYNEFCFVELCFDFSFDDVKMVIWVVYCQVLGNDYIMDFECFKGVEFFLINGFISVWEFVCIVVKLEFYKKKFFYNNF